SRLSWPLSSSMRYVAIGSSAEHGSSISTTSGSQSQGAGDTQALLLAARQRGTGGFLPVVLDLVPQRRRRARSPISASSRRLAAPCKTSRGNLAAARRHQVNGALSPRKRASHTLAPSPVGSADSPRVAFRLQPVCSARACRDNDRTGGRAVPATRACGTRAGGAARATARAVRRASHTG